MKLRDLDPDRANWNIYTHVFPDGRNIHIASGLLRKWCLANNPEIVMAPVRQELGRTFRETNAVDLRRVRGLTPAQRSEPIIFCATGYNNGIPNVLLVDGHHRYYRALIENERWIKSWILTPPEWAPFIIEDAPQITYKQMVSCDTSLNRTYWKD